MEEPVLFLVEHRVVFLQPAVHHGEVRFSDETHEMRQPPPGARKLQQDRIALAREIDLRRRQKHLGYRRTRLQCRDRHDGVFIFYRHRIVNVVKLRMNSRRLGQIFAFKARNVMRQHRSENPDQITTPTQPFVRVMDVPIGQFPLKQSEPALDRVKVVMSVIVPRSRSGEEFAEPAALVGELSVGPAPRVGLFQFLRAAQVAKHRVMKHDPLALPVCVGGVKGEGFAEFLGQRVFPVLRKVRVRIDCELDDADVEKTAPQGVEHRFSVGTEFTCSSDDEMRRRACELLQNRGIDHSGRADDDVIFISEEDGELLTNNIRGGEDDDFHLVRERIEGERHKKGAALKRAAPVDTVITNGVSNA